jgi:hypothetical protein
MFRSPLSQKAAVAASDRAPTRRLARTGGAAAAGGFGPTGTGGAAAWRGSGVQRPDRHVACNIIVGPYCVSFQTGPS